MVRDVIWLSPFTPCVPRAPVRPGAPVSPFGPALPAWPFSVISAHTEVSVGEMFVFSWSAR